MIGRVQRVDILPPYITGSPKIGAAPCEAQVTLSDDEQIRREPRSASVAVGKWMHSNQSMMETHRKLVGRVSLMANPVLRIADSLAKVGLNPKRRNSQIALGGAILSRPSPNAIEHSAMKTSEKRFIENISLAGKSPAICVCDVLLFEFVEFAS